MTTWFSRYSSSHNSIYIIDTFNNYVTSKNYLEMTYNEFHVQLNSLKTIDMNISSFSIQVIFLYIKEKKFRQRVED